MPNESDQTERLIEVMEQLSDDMAGLMQVVEEGSLLQKLVTEMQTLHSAIDDLRAEVEWASRNLLQARSPRPPLEPLASMPVDSCDVNFAAKVNAVSRRELPPSESEMPPNAGDLDPEDADDLPEPTFRKLARTLGSLRSYRINTNAVGRRTIHVTADELERLIEQNLFDECCDYPEITWSGEPETPTVQCQHCSVIFVDEGEIIVGDECLPPLVADQAANQHEAIRKPAPTAGPSVPVKNIGVAKRNKVPLYARILSQHHMTDLVRLIGYDEIPFEDFSERKLPLEAKYGKETIDAAVRELVTLVRRDHLPFVRLSNAARPFVVQILGRPPAS